MRPRGNVMLNREVNRGTGLWQLLKCKEENLRIFVLGIAIYIYLALGACMFQAVEQAREDQIQSGWNSHYDRFLDHFSADNESEAILLTRRDLEDFLSAYGDAIKAGFGGLHSRDKWDYRGSFHYAWTIVSTIGYGATSPGTFLGKMLTIVYALGGVASGLLFFNLYLERIITFITTWMRYLRNLRQRRRPSIYTAPIKGSVNDKLARRPSQSSVENESALEMQDWKPSVHSVLLCLLLKSATYIFLSALVFQFMEGWTYFDSLYFCFVSFATIGFGDLVILQQNEYMNPIVESFYHFIAFFIIGHGCCLIYSLLNVISIGIKQILNWIIKNMDCKCCFACFNWSSSSLVRRVSSRRNRSRRSRMSRKGRYTPGSGHTRAGNSKVAVIDVLDVSSGNVNEENRNSMSDLERRPSGDMVSIRGDLSNKVNLVVMQKILSETAQSHRSGHDMRQTFSATSVGPLAIASEKLAGESFHG